jgi:hypothetical protein
MGDKIHAGSASAITIAKRPKLNSTANPQMYPSECQEDTIQERSTSSGKPPSSTLMPLSNPERQIRLLQMQADDQHKILSMRMITCEHESAPPYMAISYTWGDGARRRAIAINGQIVEVNENCYYALWQTRLHFSAATVWIDYICMNQEDLVEKGHQVPAMGRIYAKATQVLACVGPHADDSQRLAYFVRPPNLPSSSHRNPPRKNWQYKLPWWLQLWWQNVPPSYANRYGYHLYLLQYIAVIDITKKVSTLGKKWILSKFSLEHKYFAGLLTVLDAFARRRYWTRLWIVQELVNARLVSILCGEHALPWTDLLLLKSIISGVKRLPESCSVFSVLEETMSRKTLSTENLLTRFSKFECQDKRDRLFGLMGLLRFSYASGSGSNHGIFGDYNQHGGNYLPLDSTFADYTKSPLDCVLQLAKHVRFSFVRKLLVAFEVDMSSAELSKLLTRRQRQTRRGTGACSHILLPYTKHCPYWRDADLIADFCTLKVDGEGGLTAPLSKCQPTSVDPAHPVRLLNAELIRRIRRRADASIQEIWVDGELTAITCKNARVGDILMFIEQSAGGSVFVVLRHSPDPWSTTFDIVGQGFAVNGYRLLTCNDHGYPRTPENYCFGIHEFGTCAMNLQIGPEDAVILVAQDFVDKDAYDVEARIERLSTPVTSLTANSACIHLTWCTNGQCTDEDKLWQYP